MNKLFLTSLLALTGLSAWAVPAINKPIVHKNADGSELTLRLIGDEHMHYFLNEKNGEKMVMDTNGKFVQLSDATLRTLEQNATERRTKTELRRAKTMAKAKSELGEPTNMTGQKKGIVLLVNFQDKEMNAANSQTVFYNMFNQEGYNQNSHIGSVADYFKAQSYGLLEIEFDVIGPLTVSKEMAYYGQNSNGGGSDMHAAEMVKEACLLADEQVNFADYDWDGDGYVDQVFVVYAGYAESSGAPANTIWPHEWDLWSAGVGALYLDDVVITTYACSSELAGTSGTSRNGIGTACHEFSHCLGYPDFYDIDYSGGLGVDNFDVMSGGSYNGPQGKGEVPCGYSAYERWLAGWLEPTELNEVMEVTDMPALNDQPIAYIVYNEQNHNEYFLIENRQSRQWFRYFNTNTAGHGMFIYHVDYNKNAWQQNKPNDSPSHQRMSWVPADQKYGTYYTQYQQWYISGSDAKGDFFPGTSKVKVFNPSLWESCGGKWFNKDTDGTYFSQHYLSNITENTTAGTISFNFDSGDNGMRYKITYKAGPGTCSRSSWTQTTSNTQETTLPDVTLDNDAWTFAGWCERYIEPVEFEMPVLYEAGSQYTPTKDVTLYAVFSYIPEEGFWTSTPNTFNPTRYTVTFDACAGTCNIEQYVQALPYDAIELPTAECQLEGWDFAGWSTQKIEEQLQRKPKLLEAGTIYTPTADIQFYAVYKNIRNEEVKWKRIEIDGMTEEGIYALISPDGHAFSGVISMGNGKTTSTTFAFDEEGYAESAPANTCELELILNEDASLGYKMYNEDKGYLYAKAASMGSLAWNETEESGWAFGSNNWCYTAKNATLRCVNNNSFRTYPGNTGSVISFAKKIVEMDGFFSSTPEPTNSIEQIEHTTATGNSIYTLDGRKLQGTSEQLPSGLYLKNGKSYFVR